MIVLGDFFYKLMIQGSEVNVSLYEDVVSIEVEDNDRFADTFTIKVASSKLPNGDWEYFQDARFQLFNNIVIKVGFSNGEQEYLIDGYITGMMLRFDPVQDQSILEIRGMDPTCLMNLEDRVVKWTNISDGEIARRIFSNYGFVPEVEDTPIEHREDSRAMMQRGTDIQFLKMLAKRNGFECYVQKDIKTDRMVGYFRKPVLDTRPQKTISALFGEESDVTKLDLFVDSLRPLTVHTQQIDVSQNAPDTTTIESSSLPKLGQSTLADIVRSKVEGISKPSIAASQTLMPTVALDPRELQNLCRSLYDESSWFVNAMAEVNSAAYEGVVKAKSLLLIRGVGGLYSGQYYVSKVTHAISKETYVQKVEAKRNAIGLTGSENFSNSSEPMTL